MHPRHALFSLLGLATLAQCSDPGDDGACGSGRCMDASADRGTADGSRTDAVADRSTTMDAQDPHAGDLVSVAVDPTSANLTARNGVAVTQAFTATAIRMDGMRRTLLSPLWSVSDTRIATISNDGVLTANGLVGGALTVRVEATAADGSTVHADAAVTVHLAYSYVDPGVPAEVPVQVPTATPADVPAPSLLYPVNNAWMPNNVPPADIQWAPEGAADDVFRVRIEKPDLTVVAYVRHTGAGFHHDWLVPRPLWRALADTDPGVDATVTVDRYSPASSQLSRSNFVHMRLVAAPIAGSIYYWDLSEGHIQRIDPSAPMPAPTPAIPNPPPSPADGNNHCVACHSISRNGRYLAGALWGGGDRGTVFDLTADLSTTPSPTVFPTDQANWLFSTFNPDASRLLINSGVGVGLLNASSGMSIAVAGMPTNVAHPEWSPDGANIALVANIAGPWAVDFTSGDLSLLPAAAGDTFGSLNTLLTGSSLASQPEGGATITHPTWSPDSHFVAFAHGTHSRSITRDAANNPTVQPGALYLVSRDGGSAQRLDNANGGSAGVTSYWPTFSPFTTADAGGATGQIWLAFYSPRDYGNELAGTRGTSRRQLWVTAIDTPTPAGSDPSHPPYWIPGQASTTDNMAAYWAAQACRMNGNDCNVSSDCCSGQCRPDPANPAHSTCQAPPAAECRREGTTCGGSGDCCSGLQCVGNVCQQPPPG